MAGVYIKWLENVWGVWRKVKEHDIAVTGNPDKFQIVVVTMYRIRRTSTVLLGGPQLARITWPLSVHFLYTFYP